MKRASNRLLAVVAVLAAMAVFGASPALAIPAPNGIRETVTFAGSDTTQDVTGVVVSDFNANIGGRNPNTVATPRDGAVNNPPVPGPAGFGVGADQFCGNRVYIAGGAGDTNPATLDPVNGSSAGRTALNASASSPSATSRGCIDIARSSSGPSSSDPATFQYYAFARDAVSWAGFQGGNQPTNLTLGQLRDIYACRVTNWNQVGGSDGQIIRYLPQTGSGTLAFFTGTVIAEPIPGSSAACPLVQNASIQENSGDVVAPADRDNAVVPYSVGQWVSQDNGVVNDIRGQATGAQAFIGNIDGLDPVIEGDPSSPNVPLINSGAFPGTRFVYNVLDTRSPSYQAALRIVGFDGAGTSRLCGGSLAAQLQTFGFTPLPSVGGNTCLGFSL